jgi:hypothetical protein
MIRAALIALAILLTAAPASAEPKSTQTQLDNCVKSQNIAECRNVVDDYYHNYVAEVKADDADAACQTMMYGAGTYMEIVGIEEDAGKPADKDAQEAAGLLGFVDQNCDSPYSDQVEQIATIAKNWKQGDTPLQVQAINIIEGKPVSLTQS